MKYNFEKVSYALTDLKNLMCTTDAYIEKFLPFRINKELGNYLQFVLDESQMRKIKILEKEKLQELYRQIIKDEEQPSFKTKMIKL